MFSSDKLRYYMFAFLAFCVLSSKNIIIYNEETLVALSFFCFIFFVSHYFGNTITESFQERSEIIQQELQNFLTIKEESLRQLVQEHQKISGIVQGVKNLAGFTAIQVQTLTTTTQKALRNVFTDQIHVKLKTLSFSKLLLQQRLQYLLAEDILSNVLVASQEFKTKGTTVSQKTIQNVIQLVVQSKAH